jgi:hypothetical protein
VNWAGWVALGLVWVAAVAFVWSLCRVAARDDLAEEELARELRQRKRQRRYAPMRTRDGRAVRGVAEEGER